jgi:hypothetical protein
MRVRKKPATGVLRHGQSRALTLVWVDGYGVVVQADVGLQVTAPQALQ